MTQRRLIVALQLGKKSYDGNGNILTYDRHGHRSPSVMDSLTYHYAAGTNRLTHVDDVVTASAYGNGPGDVSDLDDQSAGNYAYDAIGNLIKDNQEGITNITWSVYGKILQIDKTAATAGSVQRINYTYDAQGNRISKTVLKGSGNKLHTWYVRDAQGNVMATYSASGNPTDLSALNLQLSEHHLYGSSRLGILDRAVNVDGGPKDMADSNGIRYHRGLRQYELGNHLGNVLATITDKKKGIDVNGDGVVDYYEADIRTAQDYYPFGMLMPGRIGYAGSGGTWTSGAEPPPSENGLPADITLDSRTGNQPPEYKATSSITLAHGFASGASDEFRAYIDPAAAGGGSGNASSLNEGYRYGFNGKENDSEVKGTGNQQDYGMRIYDPRLGRFLSVDPLTKDYPDLTPYQFASNTPIQAIDLDGLEAFYIHGTWSNPNTFSKLSISTINEITKNTQGPVFKWSGNNTDRARRIAAEQLAQHVLSNRNLKQPLTLVGHSHGGNVAMMAANILMEKGVTVDNLITINTPIREYTVDAGAVKTHVNISQKLDPIQRGGGNAVNIPDGGLVIPIPGAPSIIPIYEGTKKGTGEMGPAGRRVKEAYNIFVPFETVFHNTHNTPQLWEDALNNIINAPKAVVPTLPMQNVESSGIDNTQVVQPIKDKVK